MQPDNTTNPNDGHRPGSSHHASTPKAGSGPFENVSETVPVSPLPAEHSSPVPQVTPCPSGVISGASSDRPRGAVEEARAALLASTKEREELRAELGRLQNRRLAERVDQAEAAMVAAREAFAALATARFFQDATYLDLRPVLGRASAAVGIGEPEQTASWPEALDTATQALTDAEARRDALAERDADAMRPEPVAVTGSDPRWSAILAVVGTLPEVHREGVLDALCEAYSYGVERGVERGQPDVRDSEPEPERYEPARRHCWGDHLWMHGHQCDAATFGTGDQQPTYCCACDGDVPADQWRRLYVRTSEEAAK